MKLAIYLAAAGSLLLVLAANAAAASYGCKSDAKYCLVSDSCKSSDRVCGSITYANKGGYVVSPVKLSAKDSQPTGRATIHPSCSGVNFSSGADYDVGQYIQFIVPADCAYKLKINIKAGSKKSRDLFLTPGCVIKTSTDGTTMSNKWHMTTSWSQEAKDKGLSGGVQADSQGNVCGRLSNM